jgi:hypothetical protein
MWKEVFWTIFLAIFWYFPGNTEKQNDKPQSHYSVLWATFQAIVTRVRATGLTVELNLLVQSLRPYDSECCAYFRILCPFSAGGFSVEAILSSVNTFLLN